MMYEKFDLCMTREALEWLQRAIEGCDALAAPVHAQHELICLRNEIRARLQHIDAGIPGGEPTDAELLS